MRGKTRDPRLRTPGARAFATRCCRNTHSARTALRTALRTGNARIRSAMQEKLTEAPKTCTKAQASHTGHVGQLRITKLMFRSHLPSLEMRSPKNDLWAPKQKVAPPLGNTMSKYLGDVKNRWFYKLSIKTSMRNPCGFFFYEGPASGELRPRFCSFNYIPSTP